MKNLGLWSPGLQNIVWKICKTLQPPSYILNVRSLRLDIPLKLIAVEKSVEVLLSRNKLTAENIDIESKIHTHIESLIRNLALYLPRYGNFIVLRDLNTSIDDRYLIFFCDAFNLKSLIQEFTTKTLKNHLTLV